MFIDRAGAKVGLIEQLSRNSKASLSFVAEQVSMFSLGSAQLSIQQRMPNMPTAPSQSLCSHHSLSCRQPLNLTSNQTLMAP